MSITPGQFGEIDCSSCGYQIVEVVSKTGHEFRINKDEPFVDDVDFDEGEAIIYCPDCGDEVRVKLPFW